MKNKRILNYKEVVTLLINLMSVKLFFTFPKKLIVNSGNAAWIQILYVTAVFFLCFAITGALYKGCSGKSVIALSEEIGGKPAKFIVGTLILLVLSLNFSSILRSYPDMVKLVLLPDTPYEMIFLVYAGIVGIAAYVGIEAIAGIHALFVPVYLLIMLAFAVFLLPHAKLYNLFPIFGNGAFALFGKGITGLELFSDIIVLNLLLPDIKNAKEAKKAGVRASCACAVTAFLLTLLYGAIYPYPSSEKFIIPAYQLTRLAEIGDFFQRFEAFFEFVRSISVFLYSAFYLCMICRLFAEIFDLKYEKPLIFPTIFSIITLSAEKIPVGYEAKLPTVIAILLISFALTPVVAVIYKLKTKERSLS